MTNQCLDSFSKDTNYLKKSLEFFQNKYHDNFKNLIDKVQKLENEINIMKEELHVIQTTKPLWAIDKDAQLVDLDHSRGNNLTVKGT